jgi:hypothetical protein
MALLRWTASLRAFAYCSLLSVVSCAQQRDSPLVITAKVRAISPVFHKAFSVPFNFFGAVAYTKRNATVSIKRRS